MKVIVDFDLCDANGYCMEEAPEVFRLEENDMLTILMENPPDSLRKKVRAAEHACPKLAITVED